ncbi:hypothetical protein MSG28_005656, partial [Choristoneura fumiferana]
MTLLERCDDNHVGHFFFRYMQNRPDDIFHIDAATGEQETRRSVLARTTRLAQCFRNMGLQPGDVLLLGGKNHLDMFIPFYAALMSGLPIAGVDPQFKYKFPLLIQTRSIAGWSARMNKSAQLLQAYGQTENGGPVLDPVPEGPSGNLGKPTPTYQIKIVDPESGTVIQEPNVTGELWAKGPTMACYYNNPKATAEAFSEDGYYKTGDLVYRDENDYYFFVIPPEVEEVILMHDGVADVCVTGVPHPDDGELVVACVVRKPGSTVTAKEIKDLVASELSVHKHLHGGVVFMDALPLTSTGKRKVSIQFYIENEFEQSRASSADDGLENHSFCKQDAHVDDDDDDGDDDDGGGGDSDDCDTRNVFDQYVVKHK